MLEALVEAVERVQPVAIERVSEAVRRTEVDSIERVLPAGRAVLLDVLQQLQLKIDVGQIALVDLFRADELERLKRYPEHLVTVLNADAGIEGEGTQAP